MALVVTHFNHGRNLLANLYCLVYQRRCAHDAIFFVNNSSLMFLNLLEVNSKLNFFASCPVMTPHSYFLTCSFTGLH